MEFNDRITKVIEYSKLSPAEFAEEIGVQRSSISHIVSGRNKPSLDFITKIKNKFPDLEWNWLITGEGEMLVSEKEETPEPIQIIDEPKVKEKKSIPDLFSLIDDDNFGKDLSPQSDSRESNRTDEHEGIKKISDSQRLDKIDDITMPQRKEIKRIVFFYHDGTFETYEN